MAWEFFDDDRTYLHNLNIGERDFTVGCYPCPLEPDGEWVEIEYPPEDRDITLAARSSTTLQLLFKKTYAYKELGEQD